MKVSLSIFTLIINLVLFAQFSHLSVIAWLRIRHGKNGLTPFLLLVSVALTALIALDVAFQITIISGWMGSSLVMAPLQGIEVITRTVLMVANTVYVVAIRREAFASLKRMTRTREHLHGELKDL